MTNKERLIDEIKFARETNKAFDSEMNYYMNDVDHSEMEEEGEPYDEADAFDDVFDLAQEGDDKESRSIVDECRRILIVVGYYIEIDITKVVVSHGKRYDFKKHGKHYQCITYWQNWINQ